MKPNNRSKGNRNFLNNLSENPFYIALGAGLYPLIFYYSRNFGMINSWAQFGYFLLLFLILPLIFFSLLKWISTKPFALKWSKYALPFFSVFLFLFYLKLILYADVQKKIILGILVISAICTYFLYKHFQRWIALQLVLAVIGFISLAPVIIKYLNYSSDWTKHPDDIESVLFKKKPNIYYIQPDGYVNFSELEKGFYQVDNSAFEDYLLENEFKNYPEFRSNYLSTLTSNSSTFMMKHHYYNEATDYSEMVNARKNIISENTVLSVFKNNGYKTHFITEHPYLMVNRPEIGFDYTNFEYSDIPYITTGFNVKKEVFSDLENAVSAKQQTGNFFFIEFFEPSHVASTKAASKGKVMEREKWLEKRDIANNKIIEMVNLIVEKDPEALIMIMADHGGFVGLDYTQEIAKQTADRDIIYSAFGSMLSIRWPNAAIPTTDSQLKTSVNSFRVLFSYLSEDEKYLKHLEDDKSFVILNDDGTNGIYEYIDENGHITSKKI